ncbi:MAG TPA: PEP-CTERM sorting domain-containing protein [Cyanobacteria bacterium UBA11162]|nr:PEP-CTERM sorting domain-containing protein [Cyanobacteria bacterium UBA11162]
MQELIKQVLLGASVVASVSAIATNAAFAVSLTGATLGGNAPHLRYNSNSQYTYTDSSASLSTILTGNSSSPTGNIELFSNSEQSPISPSSNLPPSPSNLLPAFTTFYNFLGYNEFTSLSGQIGDKDITLSSLTAVDWFGAAAVTKARQDIANALSPTNGLTLSARINALNLAINPLYNSPNLATNWFQEALGTYGLSSNQSDFNMFLLAGGFQRFSDPNISYVNQDGNGLLRIGLAGHYDAAALLKLPSNPNHPIQASELVKVIYNDQPAQYLYGFTATQSGLHNNEAFGNSGSSYNGSDHSGNYELTLQGEAPASIPEPSIVLGLMTLGGIFVAKQKLHKS